MFKVLKALKLARPPQPDPVGKPFPSGSELMSSPECRGTGLRPQALRENRILAEIHATDGDVRRTCDPFGVTIGTP